MRKRVTMALDADLLVYLEWQASLAHTTVPARANALLRTVMQQEMQNAITAKHFHAYKERVARASAFVPLDAKVASNGR